ncbi:MAG: phospholipid carrier-dependent glycosyltransferase, partial [Thermoanaerobaculia bacterium]
MAFAAGFVPGARLAGRVDEAGVLRLAFAVPLGLGLIAQAFFLVGIAGEFGAGAIGVVALLALIAGVRHRAAAGADVAAVLAGGWVRRPLFWGLAAGALAGPAWLALYPPVSWDDTIYHLPLARSLVEHGRYLFVGNLRLPVFPLLGETLFAPALLCGRASTAHGVSLVATGATAILLLAWGAGRFADFRRQNGSLRWALAPAAIWIGQPIVVFYAGSSFIEPLLTLFATASILAFERWRDESKEPGEPSDRGGRRWAWLLAAGAFAGWAAATKYLGLYLV